MTTFITRDVPVEAIRLRASTTVGLLRGSIKGEVGDWLVTLRSKDGISAQFLFPDSEFRALFQPTSDPASRRAWAERFPHELDSPP